MMYNDFWNAAIGILIILCLGGFTIWIQNSYKSKQAREEETDGKGFFSGRKADLFLVCMLLISAGISVGITPIILDHLRQYPDSLLRIPINILGRLTGIGPYLYLEDKGDILTGIFFLPFLLLSICSFIIYEKCFKGKIVQSKWSNISGRCLSCGKTMSNNSVNQLCDVCTSSARRIKYAVVAILGGIALIAIAFIFFTRY